MRRNEALPSTSDNRRSAATTTTLPTTLEMINGRRGLEIFRDTKRLRRDRRYVDEENDDNDDDYSNEDNIQHHLKEEQEEEEEDEEEEVEEKGINVTENENYWMQCRKKRKISVKEQETVEESKLERKFVEFMEYTKKRDEEHRNILLKMLETIEDIKNSFR